MRQIETICALALLATGAPLSAAVTAVAVDSVNAQHAVIRATVTNPANCQVLVSTDPAGVNLVSDTNESITPGSTSCNRATSIVAGTSFSFALGTAPGALLAPATLYYLKIKDLSDSSSYTTPFVSQPVSASAPQALWVQAAGVTGDQVRVAYGYAENGTPAELYCQSGTACYTAWTPCAPSCSISVPVLGGHVIYMSLARQSANGAISSEQLTASAVSGASIPSVFQGSTATQALAQFTVTDPARCLIAVYSDAGHTILAHDSDTSLFAGAQACNRAGNVVNGSQITAVMGARTVQTALDSNNYSRSLAAATHYFVAITDSVTSATQSFDFFTTGIPFGATWNDPPPVLAPTISGTDATQTIIDTTGATLHRLTLNADVSTAVTWDQAGNPQGNVSCSGVPVTGPTGTGVHCWANPGLYWVNTTTLQRTFLGVAKLPFNGATDGWNSLWCTSLVFDQTDGNRMYCYVGNGWGYLIALEYSGSNADVGPTGINTPLGAGWAFTNLVPASTHHDLASQFAAFDAATAAFAAQYGVAVDFGCIEGADLEFQIRPAAGDTNDTIGWTALFNLASGAFSAISPPSRWAGTHGAGPANVTGWAAIVSEGFKGPASGSDADANGPYIANLAAAVSGTATTCPAYNPATNIPAAEWPVGGVCSTLTLDGQPYDPSPGPHEVTGSPHIGNQSGYYAGALQPGDKFCFSPSGSSYTNANIGTCPELYETGGEFARVLAVVSDTSIIVQRGYFGPTTGTPGTAQGIRAHASGDQIRMIPLACEVGLSGFGCTNVGTGWHYAVHTQGEPYPLMSWTTATGAGHGMSGYNWFVQASSTLTPTFDGDSASGYNVSYSTSPLDAPTVDNWLPLNAGFSGHLGEGSPNAVDSHPSAVQPTFFLDARPFLGDAALTSCSTIASGLLKCTSARLRRKYLPTLAMAGHIELTDVSGPASVIDGSSGNYYKYCVAVLPGECRAGSFAGDLFVNPGLATETGCTAMGIGVYNPALTSICVGDQGSYLNGITQVQLQNSLLGPATSTGAATRLLTTALAGYFWPGPFWNAKASPDGTITLIYAPGTGSVRPEAFLLATPAIAGSPTLPSGYKTLSVAVPATAYALVRFGYDAGYHCTTDSDSCVTGGTPWNYAREGTTPTSCSSGCTISVPAIPGRPIYYRVDQTDASGNVLTAGAPVVAIP